MTKKDTNKDEVVEPVPGIPPAPKTAERFEPAPVDAPEKIEKEGAK